MDIEHLEPLRQNQQVVANNTQRQATIPHTDGAQPGQGHQNTKDSATDGHSDDDHGTSEDSESNDSETHPRQMRRKKRVLKRRRLYDMLRASHFLPVFNSKACGKKCLKRLIKETNAYAAYQSDVTETRLPKREQT